MGAGRRDLFVRPGPDPHHGCQHQVGHFPKSCVVGKERTFLYVSFLSFSRSLSVILILDLSKPNALWGTMEKLLQAAQDQLEKVSSQAQQAQKAKHQPAVHLAARLLPKDYPVSPQLIAPNTKWHI